MTACPLHPPGTVHRLAAQSGEVLQLFQPTGETPNVQEVNVQGLGMRLCATQIPASINPINRVTTDFIGFTFSGVLLILLPKTEFKHSASIFNAGNLNCQKRRRNGWTMDDGGLKMDDGGLTMEDGGWTMEDGGWRMTMDIIAFIPRGVVLVAWHLDDGLDAAKFTPCRPRLWKLPLVSPFSWFWVDWPTSTQSQKLKIIGNERWSFTFLAGDSCKGFSLTSNLSSQ